MYEHLSVETSRARVGANDIAEKINIEEVERTAEMTDYKAPLKRKIFYIDPC